MSKPYTLESFIKRANQTHNNKYTYENVVFINCTEKVEITCPIHGTFWKTPTHHMVGRGCEKCGYKSCAEKLRSNKEDFIEKARKIHGDTYSYDLVDYISAIKPIVLICKKHGEFEITPHIHLCGQGCKLCGYERNSLTQEEFIKRSTEIHNNFYNYEKTIYTNIRTRVIITCPIHGDFSQKAEHHLLGRGCRKCKGFEVSDNESFIEKSRKIHGNKFDYSFVKYSGTQDKVVIVCPIHGKFEQTPNSHCSGSGCYKCGLESMRDTTEEFIQKARTIHGKTYSYEKTNYIKGQDPVIIICKKHGEFKQKPSIHLKGNGCRKCKRTKRQTAWLNFLGIPDDEEHREVYIKIGKKKFYVDGFDPKTNTIYEFDGDYWHGNPKYYKPEGVIPHNKQTFGQVYNKTIEKKKTLIEAGYNVISIWESDYEVQYEDSKYWIYTH